MSWKITRRSFPVLRASRNPWSCHGRGETVTLRRLRWDAPSLSIWQARTLLQFGTCITYRSDGKRYVYILEQS